MTPVVKICGITNKNDAELAIRFGADALGFNFYRRSPRYVVAELAADLVRTLSDDIHTVGVFVNEPLEIMAEIARQTGIHAVQLHGDESPDYVLAAKEMTGVKVIKAFRVSADFELSDTVTSGADAVLLDSFSKFEYGGTGKTFDWELAKRINRLVPQMYLAGGLDPSNVADAIEAVQPFGVDACSGIESEKGKKDIAKLKEFIRRAKRR